MPYANLHIEIDDTKLLNIQTSLDKLKTELDFVINLTPKERQKAGPFVRRREAFRQTAFEIANAEPQLVVGSLDMSAWRTDLQALEQLTTIQRALTQLLESVDDTTIAFTMESTKTASLFYTTLKAQSKLNIPGVDTMIDKLGKSLGNTRKGKKKQKEE